MSTQEAFTELTSKRNWYKSLGLNESTARSHKKNFNDGTISLNTVFKLLEKAGYVSEVNWSSRQFINSVFSTLD